MTRPEPEEPLTGILESLVGSSHVPGTVSAMSEIGDPTNPADDEAEAAEPAEESTGDNPDVDDE